MTMTVRLNETEGEFKATTYWEANKSKMTIPLYKTRPPSAQRRFFLPFASIAVYGAAAVMYGYPCVNSPRAQ